MAVKIGFSLEDMSAYVAAGVEHFVLDFSVRTVAEMLRRRAALTG